MLALTPDGKIVRTEYTYKERKVFTHKPIRINNGKLLIDSSNENTFYDVSELDNIIYHNGIVDDKEFKKLYEKSDAIRITHSHDNGFSDNGKSQYFEFGIGFFKLFMEAMTSDNLKYFIKAHIVKNVIDIKTDLSCFYDAKIVAHESGIYRFDYIKFYMDGGYKAIINSNAHEDPVVIITNIVDTDVFTKAYREAISELINDVYIATKIISSSRK